MKTLPVEPASLLLGADESDAATRHDFEARFWPEFVALRDCWTLNERRQKLRLPWSNALQVAVNALFPFKSTPGHWHPSGFDAYSQIVRFLADRAVFWNFAGAAETWLTLLPRPGIYSDDDVWLAWCDLLEQCFEELRRLDATTCDLFASSTNVSCLSTPEMSADGKTLVARRIPQRQWPVGFLDPSALTAMVARRGQASSVPVVYEQSGHQPSRAIKKVIERTANGERVRAFVTRAGTTYFHPNLAETCKVWTEATPSEVLFRVSDRACTVKGVFKTVAENPLEALVAEALIRDQFVELCAEEGLIIASVTP